MRNGDRIVALAELADRPITVRSGTLVMLVAVILGLSADQAVIPAIRSALGVAADRDVAAVRDDVAQLQRDVSEMRIRMDEIAAIIRAAHQPHDIDLGDVPSAGP